MLVCRQFTLFLLLLLCLCVDLLWVLLRWLCLHVDIDWVAEHRPVWRESSEAALLSCAVVSGASWFHRLPDQVVLVP